MRARRVLVCTCALLTPLACGGDGGTGGPSGPVPVASVDVTPAQVELEVAETVQLNVTLRSGDGSVLAGRSISYSSSNASVVTVSSSGLATAEGKGQAQITVSSEGVSDASAIAVILADFAPKQDSQLDGLLEFASFEIAEGVKVDATDDLELVVEGIVTIAGILEADCDGISIKGSAGVTITGTIQNTCAEAGDVGGALVVAGDGDLEMSGAKVASSGLITVLNDLAMLDVFDGALAAPARTARQGGTCIVEDTEIASDAAAAPGMADGATIRFGCNGDVAFAGGNELRAQGGGPGSDANHAPGEGSAQATGQDGGGGGAVDIRSTGSISIDASEGQTTIATGTGGNGGAATATANQSGAAATASGGDGGGSGGLSLEADGDLDLDGLSIVVGGGGDGGDANGLAADGDAPGEAGGDAGAEGGAGGDTPDLSIVVGGTLSGEADVVVSEGDAGKGGAAEAHGGRGADGAASSPDGGAGGAAATMNLLNGLVGLGGAGGPAVFGGAVGGRGGAGGAGSVAGAGGNARIDAGTGDGGDGGGRRPTGGSRSFRPRRDHGRERPHR